MIAIEAQNLGKAYKIRHGSGSLYGTMLDTLRRKKAEQFWAVRNLNFQVKKGQTLGFIGHNGSGKSSTLGLTTGTINPTEGFVKTEGRVSALLELGAGFHAELTGRENVFLNAALMGIAREDIQRKMDAIIDFSGLHEFIDQPVKNYSSGMYVRLGFAVATEIDPDILLVDEVLAVGDVEFQTKSIERMRSFKRKGKTILFVSHDLGAVQQFCDEVILLDHGSLVDRGEPDWIVGHYSKSMMIEEAQDEEQLMKRRAEILKEEAQRAREVNTPKLHARDEVPTDNEFIHKHEHGSKVIEFTGAQIVDENGLPTYEADDPKKIVISISYDVHIVPENDVVFGFSLKNEFGVNLFGTNSELEEVSFGKLRKGSRQFTVTLDTTLLMKGRYYLSLAAHSSDHLTQYHRQEDFYPFNVGYQVLEKRFLGSTYIHNEWKLDT